MIDLLYLDSGAFSAEKVGYGTVYYGRIQKKKDENTGLITS